MSKVLIADDVKEMRDLLVQIIEALGHETVEAATGAKVLEVMDQEGDKIALALLDIGMPGYNGIEVTKQMKQAYPDLKICFVSGSKEKEMVANAIQAGGDDYVVKPVDILILRQKVEKLLGGSGADQFIAAAAALKAKLPNLPMDVPLLVTEISEVSFQFQSAFPFQKDSRLDVDIQRISKLMGETHVLQCKVDEVLQVAGQPVHNHQCTFYGMHETVRQAIRSLTMKGVKIVDED